MGDSGKTMFTGQQTVALDGKNRLLIPSRMREEMAALAGDASVVYLTKGHDGCLVMFPRQIFEKMAAEHARLLRYEEPKDRSVNRVFFGEAEKVVLDRLGRILLPERLKRAAGLVKDLTLVGVFDRLELWNREKWESYSSAGEATFDQDARDVFSTRRAVQENAVQENREEAHHQGT